MSKLSYKEKYKRIKNFVNFSFDLRLSEKNFYKSLSLSDKQKISHYYKILFGEPKTDREQGAVNYDVYEYRPRSEKRKKLAAEYAQITGGYKELKVIPIPRADKNVKPKLNFKNNYLEVKEKNITRHVAYFDLKNLSKDPKKEIDRVIRVLKKRGEVQAVMPMTGTREIMDAQKLFETVTDDIIKLMEKYSENFHKWLLGLAGYEFTNQASFPEYMAARKKDKKSREKRERKICPSCKKILNKTELKNKKCSKCKTKLK